MRLASRPFVGRRDRPTLGSLWLLVSRLMGLSPRDITASTQFSPQKTRGHHGSLQNRPSGVQWDMRTGPASARSTRSACSPRNTSFVDQSFHRAAHKFSPVEGFFIPRNPVGCRTFGHQQKSWQASRLSELTPIAWHRPVEYAHTYRSDQSFAAPWAFTPRPRTAFAPIPYAPPRKTSRTIDFWQ